MPIHTEINFENDICEHLRGAGWLYAQGDAAQYDRGLALFPADTIPWVKDPIRTPGRSLKRSTVKRLRQRC